MTNPQARRVRRVKMKTICSILIISIINQASSIIKKDYHNKTIAVKWGIEE